MAVEQHRKLVSAAFNTAWDLLGPPRRYGSEQTALAAFLRKKRLSGYSVESREQILHEAVVKVENAIQFFSKCRQEFDYPFDYVQIEAQGALGRLANILGKPRDEISEALNQFVTEWIIGKLQMNRIDTPDDFRKCCDAHFGFLASDYRMHALSDDDIKRLDPDICEFRNDHFTAEYMNDSHRIDVEGRGYGHSIVIRLGPVGSHYNLRDLDDELARSEADQIQDTDSQYEILKTKAVLLADRLPRLLESSDKVKP